MFDKISLIIGGLLLVTNAFTGVSSWSKGKTIDLNIQTIEKLKAQKAISDANVQALESSINIQNEKISDLSIDLNASMERWQNRTPSVQYVDRWLTKYVDRNVTTTTTKDECENTHNIFDAIRDNF